MELGETMELLGEEVGQLWGRRPPLYSGGKDPTVTPLLSPRDAVLPHTIAVLPQGVAVLLLNSVVLPLAR